MDTQFASRLPNGSWPGSCVNVRQDLVCDLWAFDMGWCHLCFTHIGQPHTSGACVFVCANSTIYSNSINKTAWICMPNKYGRLCACVCARSFYWHMCVTVRHGSSQANVNIQLVKCLLFRGMRSDLENLFWTNNNNIYCFLWLFGGQFSWMIAHAFPSFPKQTIQKCPYLKSNSLGRQGRRLASSQQQAGMPLIDECFVYFPNK